jgi:hypothetical protein
MSARGSLFGHCRFGDGLLGPTTSSGQPANFSALALEWRLALRTPVYNPAPAIGVGILVLRFVRVWMLAAGASEREALSGCRSAPPDDNENERNNSHAKRTRGARQRSPACQMNWKLLAVIPPAAA